MRETFPFFEIKEIGDNGAFVGIASVYGVEDLGGDVIDKGAFKKTLQENPNVPILWQHDASEVIGQGVAKEWQNKILLEASLDMEDPMGMKAYQKLKNRLIKGLSIGFSTIKHSWEEVEGRMIRHISELKLWEVSVVTFPMLPDAQVTRVKSLEDEALKEALKSRIEALEQSVSALQAAKSTPPEPEKATEPPPTSIEPDYHSLLLSSIRNFKL